VTGGGTGIGRAVALDLAGCGADVVICGRRPEPLEKTAAEIEALGARVLVVPADIRDDDRVVGLIDRALEHFGRIDTLVNNAGGQFAAPAEQITSKGWRAVHRVAVDATWAVTREVAMRAMIPQRSGVIFFMAFSPRRGIASMVHASSARAALENLAAGLSLEWSRFGIRTICVAPGTIATGNGAELRRRRPKRMGSGGPAAPLRHPGGSLRGDRLPRLDCGQLRHRHHDRRRRRRRCLGRRSPGTTARYQ
jgi:citronellol/citronellal dehydrogenase